MKQLTFYEIIGVCRIQNFALQVITPRVSVLYCKFIAPASWNYTLAVKRNPYIHLPTSVLLMFYYGFVPIKTTNACGQTIYLSFKMYPYFFTTLVYSYWGLCDLRRLYKCSLFQSITDWFLWTDDDGFVKLLRISMSVAQPTEHIRVWYSIDYTKTTFVTRRMTRTFISISL